MTERDRNLDPSDRRDAPPDPESGAPLDVPVAFGVDEAVQAPPPGAAVAAPPSRPGPLSYLLAIVLPGVPQLRTGRTGLGVVLLLTWLVVIGVVVLAWERIVAVTGTGSLDDQVAVATLAVLVLVAWFVGIRDLRRPAETGAGDSQWSIAARHFRKNRVAVVGLGVIALFYLIAMIAPLIAPYDPIAQQDIARTSFLPPSSEHWLGTDRFGRDVLSRILYGARISLSIAFVATAISITLGTLIGAIAGYAGGKVDTMLMRFTDMVLAFPRLVLLIMIVALFSPSIAVIITVLGLTQWPSTTRIVRGDVLSLREREFVQAARALGFSSRRILLRHLIPNVLAPVIVAATLGIGNTIVLEAGLSFLGLGVSAPTPTWGNMVNEGRDNLLGAWWLATFPGLTIVFVVLAFNLVGDGLRDALDPRLRS
ncbi:MAG TPA: oligopeptide ABC transporter permease [Longimicrobiales bacterium]|nr:oligopeptide ABC transporter permease [Longimicrobiales bacterium]